MGVCVRHDRGFLPERDIGVVSGRDGVGGGAAFMQRHSPWEISNLTHFPIKQGAFFMPMSPHSLDMSAHCSSIKSHSRVSDLASTWRKRMEREREEGE